MLVCHDVSQTHMVPVVYLDQLLLVRRQYCMDHQAFSKQMHAMMREAEHGITGILWAVDPLPLDAGHVDFLCSECEWLKL